MAKQKTYTGTCLVPFNVGKDKKGFKKSYKRGDKFTTSNESSFIHLVQTNRIK